VRLQAETAGTPGGPLTRADDEGITFVAGANVTFDVRDLVSGAARGETFEVVSLGTAGNDTMLAVAADRSYYFNAGGGDDTVDGSSTADFLVGNVGDDQLSGKGGADTLLGGGGKDKLFGDAGADRLDGGAGKDIVWGQGGADVFVFSAAGDSTAAKGGRDRLVTFDTGVDKIDLTALNITDFDEQVQLDTVTFDNGKSRTVVRVDLDDDGAFDDFGITIRGDAPVEGDFLI
jgi:Ca2+-binding RTX toxin-like protein